MDERLKELEAQELDITCALNARLTEYGKMELWKRLVKVLQEKTELLKQKLATIKRDGNYSN